MENLQRREVKANFRLEFKDYKDFNIHHSKKHFYGAGILYFILFMSTMLFKIFSNDLDGDMLKNILIVMIPTGILLISLVLLAFYFLIAFHSKKVFKSQRRLQEEQNYIINDDGILLISKSSNNNIGWKNIFKITESQNSIFLYLGDIKAMIIPKRAFGGEDNVAVLKEIIKRNLEPDKVKLK
ncbi:MAG: YcxB family protein [Clostridium argentinense]|uniref:YcxB family protein n=1 Tax=Clostridium faecium TaxID=2762223 RepID=A0ABR8YUP0_9CLOT|nr:MULTISPECIES: YcxB family protein [Clostridium]MBD8047914.1 YcxB family protein [Clostridium faecium]MBS5822516.1 YcxB family protein [Clostridium argentinense]MDU1347955.1 YcxB family protein [Clostridium argentinense]